MAYILTLIGIFALAGALTSYPFFRYMMGFTMFGLGVWLIYNPMMAVGNPLNDILLTICFVGGVGVLFWANWSFGKDKNGREGFNFRIPKVFGGESEEEEAARVRRSTVTWRDRTTSYSEKLKDATNGRRTHLR